MRDALAFAFSVGAASAAMLLKSQSRAFALLRSASYFLLGGQEKVAKEKATPLGACRAMPGKFVSRGRAFRSGILPERKGIDIHVDARFTA